jgi:hypothetical protein
MVEIGLNLFLRLKNLAAFEESGLQINAVRLAGRAVFIKDELRCLQSIVGAAFASPRL